MMSIRSLILVDLVAIPLGLMCGSVVAKNVNGPVKDYDDGYTYSYRAYYEIEEIFREHKIIPDVIDHGPEHKTEIAYNADAYAGDFLDFGTYFTMDQVKNPPNWIKWPALSGLLYTLIMICPDYPTRENPTEKEWQHWVVTNIHGSDLKMAETLTEYSAPHELAGKAPQRFVFLIYLQRSMNIVKFEEPRLKKEVTPSKRANFSTKLFAEKYKFKQLIAGNFFLMRPQNFTKAKGKR